MADEANKKAIEEQIGAAMKPLEPQFGKRPRIFTAADKDFEPVRTLTQFLTDIEGIAKDNLALVQDQNKHLAEILNSINERLSRIENSIGVR